MEIVNSDQISLICEVCNEINPQQPRCKNCGIPFTEHVCIKCGLVFYCNNLRYEEHRLYDHKHCFLCWKLVGCPRI